MKLAPGAILFLSTMGCSAAPAPKPAPAASAATAKERSFHFEYLAKVAAVPQGAKDVRIWVPLPQTDAAQTITNLKVDSPLSHRETRDALYGNRIAYFEVSGAAPQEIPIKVSFDAHRVETSSDRKSTRLNSSHIQKSRMPSSA